MIFESAGDLTLASTWGAEVCTVDVFHYGRGVPCFGRVVSKLKDSLSLGKT